MRQRGIQTLQTILHRQADEIVRRRNVLLRRPSHNESIHKIRVATRRVRQALRLAAEAAADRRARTWLKRFRRLGRVLGNPRGLDVSIELLRRRYASRHPATVRYAVSELRRRRRRSDERIVEALARFKAKKFRGEIDRLMKKSTDRPDRGWEKLLRASITGHGRRLRAAAGSREESMRSRLHELRLRIKKLRYRMEIADDLGHRSYASPIGVLTRFQKLLGDWRDHQMLLEHLGDLRAPADKNARRGLSALFDDVGSHERRAKDRALRALRAGIRRIL